MEINNTENENIPYLDPNEDILKNIFDSLKNCKSSDEIQNVIENTFPGWLIHGTDKYSDDYPNLQENWLKICNMINTTPKKIVIVDDIYFDKNHLLINIFCERMTREGYIVRRKCEFQCCEICGCAIPTFNLYLTMKQKGLKVPNEWRRKCKKCNI